MKKQLKIRVHLMVFIPFLSISLFCSFFPRKSIDCLGQIAIDNPTFSGTFLKREYRIKYLDKNITGIFTSDILGHNLFINFKIGDTSLIGGIIDGETLHLSFGPLTISGKIKDNRSNAWKRGLFDKMCCNDYDLQIGNAKFYGSIWDNKKTNELVINMFLGSTKINGSIKYCGDHRQYRVFIGDKLIYGPVSDISPKFRIRLSNAHVDFSVRYSLNSPILETNELLAFLLIDFLWEIRN